MNSIRIWRQLGREGIEAGRSTVERLMRSMGLRGAVRGRAFKVTTVADEALERPTDHVKRSFEADCKNRSIEITETVPLRSPKPIY